MEVTILGCSGGYPGPGQAASGYLLTINDKKVLIDCGSGVFSNLQLHVPLNGLDAILITHLHADHYSDLMVMRYAIDMNSKRGMEFRNVPIFAPKTPEGVINSLTNDWGYKIGYIGHESELPLFGAKAKFFRTNHPVECYGICVEYEGKVFVYTADASVDSLFAGYLDDADLCIMDCGEIEKARRPNMLHMTPKECFACAKALRVKKTILSHLVPFYDREDIELEARACGDWNYELAQVNKTYRI